MTAIATPLIMLARVSWVLQLALGSILWTGRATGLVPLHILVGLVFVLALWVLAVAGLQGGAGKTTSVAALAWGLIVLLFGLAQVRILVGTPHPIVQILHLLVGIAAIAVAEDVARGLRRAA